MTDTQGMDRCARPFTGQLRDLARAALDQQGIAVKRLRWMGQHSNHLFRWDTADGERLVVRVCPPGGRSDAEQVRRTHRRNAT
jgi:Ser/Thr protein kinase RdoA (MazF antagonist)